MSQVKEDMLFKGYGWLYFAEKIILTFCKNLSNKYRLNLLDQR